MVARLVARILPVVLILALASCSSDGGKDNPDTNGPLDIVGDGPVGDDVPGDQAVEPDNPVIPPDVPEQDQGLPPGECDPACAYGKGQYCDEADWTCKDVACTYCLKNKDCGEGLYCVEHQFANSQWGTFCTSDCQQDGDCPDGYSCLGTPGFCRPMAQCQFDACGTGALGEACDYKGSNSECGACASADLTCFGTAPDAAIPCVTDQDCVAEGFPPALHPDCTNGICGTSYCAGKCDANFGCDAGFEPMNAGFGKCYCLPLTGTGKAGAPCPVFNVHFEQEFCQSDLVCLGIEAKANPEDPEFGKCETVADCDPSQWFLNPDCVNGYCGTSFCSPYCDENDECADGFSPIDVSGTCFCAPTETGDAVEGDACPFATVHADADLCIPGLVCLGIPAAESVPCEKDADCAFTPYMGNPVCLDGWCGTSFCAGKCDAEDLCADGFEAIPVGTGDKEKCYCAPAVVGVAEVGDPCPLYNVNSAAAYCTEDLECIGSPAVSETEACVKGTDCPADLYLGTPVCFMGHCGSSVCLAPCGAETFCADSGAWLFGESGCFCIPEVKTATGKAGDACPLFNVNATAAACGAELACTGVGAFLGGDACKVASDCKAEDYPGNVECVDGICGSSYCAALCDEQGGCPVGIDPVTTETDHCFCMVP